MRQDEAVGGDHGGVEVEGSEIRLRGQVGAQADGGADWKGEFVRRDVDGTATDNLAPAGRTCGLAVDGGDGVAGLMQCPQRRDGEVRTAHEGDAHVLDRPASDEAAR